MTTAITDLESAFERISEADFLLMINDAADREKEFKEHKRKAMETECEKYKKKIQAETIEFHIKYGECPQPKLQTEGAIRLFNEDLIKLLEEYQTCIRNGVEKMMIERINTPEDMGIVPVYEPLPDSTQESRGFTRQRVLVKEYEAMCKAARENQLSQSEASLRRNISQVKTIVEFTIETSRLTEYARTSMETVIGDATKVFKSDIYNTKICTRISQPVLRQEFYQNLKTDYNNHRESMIVFSVKFHHDMKTVSFNYEWRGF